METGIEKLIKNYTRNSEFESSQIEKIPIDSFQKGVINYLKAHKETPPYIGYLISSLNRWELVSESFLETFPVDPQISPKSLVKIAKNKNTSYPHLSTNIKHLKKAIETHLIPQLIEKGNYLPPWVEDKSYANFPRLVKFLKEDGISNLCRDFYYNNDSDIFQEKIKEEILEQKLDYFKNTGTSGIDNVGVKIMERLNNYLEDKNKA